MTPLAQCTLPPGWPSAALEAFARGEPAAFATDSRQRIRFWNRGACDLLGRSAKQVLDQPCFTVVAGRDVFGNRFCHENCALLAAQRRREATHVFQLLTGGDDARALAVTPVHLQGDATESFALLHILRPASSRAPLTAREQEVLRCIGCGLQNKEIAERLHISPATVRNHVHHLLGKLQVHSKLQAATLAYRSGWTAAGCAMAASHASVDSARGAALAAEPQRGLR
jgi:DNA-binding CsgD family transcriptional regulator